MQNAVVCSENCKLVWRTTQLLHCTKPDSQLLDASTSTIARRLDLTNHWAWGGKIARIYSFGHTRLHPMGLLSCVFSRSLDLWRRFMRRFRIGSGWMNASGLARIPTPPSSDADSATSCFDKSLQITAPGETNGEINLCQTVGWTYPGPIVADHHFPSLAVHFFKSPVAAVPPSTFFSKPEGRHNQAERRKGRVYDDIVVVIIVIIIICWLSQKLKRLRFNILV